MKLENLKINFLGDSITEGHGTTADDKVFHQIIKREYGLATAINCGIGGTRIAKQNVPSNHRYDLYFGLRAKIMPRNADVIVVFGGTNDFGHGDSKMGTIDSTDIYTFCGGLNTLITDLKTDFPNSKIIFMTPLRRKTENIPNHDGKILRDYVDAITQITKKHNIPVIDLFRSGIIDPEDTDVIPDGLHPSDKGHIIMADYIAKELLKI
ncbi:MAG: SGNH/GDSL hydrolase family protein [Clostridia bacterium]|nr:SGNH/GDSL hydrolase family protein [Clostridia bacterium]